MDLKAEFEKYSDEFLKFERVESKLSTRPDVHAFMLLDRLVPGNFDIISAAEHDQFYIDIDIVGGLAEVVTSDQVRDLVRCGVRYDSEYDCLAMFT